MAGVTVVLFGADGQLGTEWSRYLYHRKIPFKPYTFANLDVTDFIQVKSVLDIDKPKFVVNASAYTQVDKAESDKDAALLVNADAVGNMAELCEAKGIILVHYSTDYVFPGLKEDMDKYPNGYPEDAPVDPINAYGLTKYRGEEAIRSAGSDHLILRVSWLCGAYGNNFVRTMIRLGSEQTELNVVGDQFGSPSFTPNVVSNSWILMQLGKKGTWHITSDGLISWYELACEALRLKNISIPVHSITTEEYPTPALRPRFSKLNISKLKSVDGVVIEDWKTGLRNLVNTLET